MGENKLVFLDVFDGFVWEPSGDAAWVWCEAQLMCSCVGDVLVGFRRLGGCGGVSQLVCVCVCVCPLPWDLGKHGEGGFG